MCGICGFYGKLNITREQLAAMNDTLYHRGPDDSGVEIYPVGEGFRAGLAHRRLAILDLSPRGHQPMVSADDRAVIVFNGEIYNFKEIREELTDYSFHSDSDTEVILAAYLKWGIDCVKRFNGMFAFGLYDRTEESLYLVRDRIGKKPLYYWRSKEGLVFASELKSIMNCPGFRGEIRQELLCRYLTEGYYTPSDTVFEGVCQLKPGTVLRVEREGMKEWKYWDILERYNGLKNTMRGSIEEAREELSDILNRAVKQRLISDVPLGTFLSGGYDSSLVTAIAQANSSKPIKTFSIGFHEPEHNEAAYAKRVASYLGTDHRELYVTENDMFAMVEDLTDYYDEPFADSSQIPSMLVAMLARKEVTVALSGDGGDEFFCGYNNYQMLAQMQKLDRLGKLTYDLFRLPGIRNMGIFERLPGKVQIVASNRHPQYRVQPFDFLQSETAVGLLKSRQLDHRFPQEERYTEENWQIRRMLLDMETYLPGDILVKVDRASMKYSLETRCPILDKEVMEYSFTLPHEFKIAAGSKKRILKEVAYRYVPKELLERPKTGFSVPLDKWLRGPLQKQLLDYTSGEFLRRQDIFYPEKMQKFIVDYLEKGDKGSGTGENYSRFVWAYFVFQKWYERYCKWKGKR